MPFARREDLGRGTTIRRVRGCWGCVKGQREWNRAQGPHEEALREWSTLQEDSGRGTSIRCVGAWRGLCKRPEGVKSNARVLRRHQEALQGWSTRRDQRVRGTSIHCVRAWRGCTRGRRPGAVARRVEHKEPAKRARSPARVVYTARRPRPWKVDTLCRGLAGFL